jgi:hypothetical protein
MLFIIIIIIIIIIIKQTLQSTRDRQQSASVRNQAKCKGLPPQLRYEVTNCVTNIMSVDNMTPQSNLLTPKEATN